MTNRYIPSDPLFNQQWHLYNYGQSVFGFDQLPGAYRNDINVTGVWPDYTGKGVTVALLDDGYQPTHPDLVDNSLVDKSYNLMTDTLGAAVGAHGTATMGLIVAAQNGRGGVGVAYDAKAAGYSSDGAGELGYNFITATAHMIADGVDISSNSWGMPYSSGPFSSIAMQPMFNNTALSLAQIGRSGLGTVTVFSSGNGRTTHENTNFTPTGSSPYVINVAAANIDGTVTSYSTPGPGILVAAPGSGSGSGSVNAIPSIVTTDLLGSAGFNKQKNGDYTNVLDPATGSVGFNGTSSAAPIVAGVVALMLEANPDLGYRDVQEILAYSAKTPAAAATWKTNGAKDWNGGGLLYNNDLGFGHVDALAAVRLAETWHKQSTFTNVASQTGSFTNGAISIEAGASHELILNFQDAVRVQHVGLTVEIAGGNGGARANPAELSMTLTGPGGQTSTVFLDSSLYPEFTALSTTLRYTFDSVQNWGEISNSGAWKLTLKNNDASGAMDMRASLSLLGDAVTPGKTFIYTADYGRLGAADADRALLADTSAGPHTLNAAAVTSDTVIDLSSDAAMIAGVHTAISPSMQFGNLFTGDGNDTLIGDAGNTTFFAGRGVNTVDGGAGVDTFSLLKSVADYVQVNHGGVTILFGNASQDNLSNIDILSFANGSLTLGSDPLVNEVYYATQNPDVFAAGAQADTHYADFGWKEGRNPNAWFDTDAYLANHADVKAAGINPLVHYSQIGWMQGDDPSAWFDASLYLHFNRDVAAAGIDPLSHFLQYGLVEGRRISMVADGANLEEAFDSTFYRLANADVASAGVNALTHYDNYGWHEGRNPNAYFDTAFYLADNPDVAAAGINPLDHYEQVGWREGRDPSTRFDTTAYLDAYADVRAAGIDPLIHYLQFGIAEERSSFAWDIG